MRKPTIIMAILLAFTSIGFAQRSTFNKIAPDLREEMDKSRSSNDKFGTLIIMEEQFDIQQHTRQLQYLGKAQQREAVTTELQQLSQRSQTEVMAYLRQGQRSAIVSDIKPLWIINAIACSMTRDMIEAIAERREVKCILTDMEIRIIDGDVNETVMVEKDRATNQWNVTKVNADDVWGMGYTGQGVTVAVIDTGVNYNHTDIANNMWDGGEDFPNHGWDFFYDDNDPIDDHGHGTHCAGTVSSYGTNNKQCGIAKDAKIMALKVMAPNNNGGASGPVSNGLLAVEFAIFHGADILSMSLGGAGYGGYWVYRIVMENALQCNVVAAVSAGNNGNNLTGYPIPNNVGSPGNCPSPWQHPSQTLSGGHSAVVTVGATTSNDSHSSFSSYGPSTWAAGDYILFYDDYPWTEGDMENIGLIKPDISAPGSDITSLSYASNDGYTGMSGTSMAAPCVAGVMALMLSVNPTLTPVEIDSIIETTATPCANQTAKNNTFGAGRIDALAAVNYMLGACAAPTNLTAVVDENDVLLSWEAASGVSTYRVYRNGAMIANNVGTTSYTDEDAPAGENTYFVRSNGSNSQASLPSDQVTVSITINNESNAPTQLAASNINSSNSTVTLSWDVPTARTENLCYTNSLSGYFGYGTETMVTAQVFPASMLQEYSGMQIEHVFFSVGEADASCTIRIFEGGAMQPGILKYTGEVTSTESQQTIDHQVSPPVVINPDKELWLTVTTSNYIGYSTSETNNDAFLYCKLDENIWTSQHGFSWSFILGLSDGAITYNLYRNKSITANGLANPTYTASYNDGINRFEVTAVSNGYESTKSNAIILVENEATINHLSVFEHDKLMLLPNSKLTVSGTLSDVNEDNLILEDGAQLIHSSSGVKATVKKGINAYTANDNGWYFIASTVTENTTATVANGLLTNNYDLYAFDQSQTLEWRNYEDNSFPLAHKTGYLYGNSGNTTLTFAGTLAATTTATTLTYDNNATLKGFNLIGNPYPCNATITNDFYTTNGSTVILAQNGTVIAPCEGVFVKATGAGQSVTFSKAVSARESVSANCIDLVISKKHDCDGGSTTLDRARVRFGEGISMEKLSLDENHSRLTLWQDGQDYAVAYADGQNELPVNFKAAENGTYTLSVETQGLELDYLHLIDNMTGADIDLLQTQNVIAGEDPQSPTPLYTFEAKTTDYASRFRLLFVNDKNDIEPSESIGFVINNVFHLSTGQSDLQIIDLHGKVLRSESQTNHIGLNGLSAGVYVVKIVANNHVATQKIVIK